MGAQSLTVMTYNIRLDVASDGENDWTHRKDKLAAQVQFYAPSILGIQKSIPHQVMNLATRLSKLIDYMYVSKADKVTVQKHAVLSDFIVVSIDIRYLSDHFAGICCLELHVIHCLFRPVVLPYYFDKNPFVLMLFQDYECAIQGKPGKKL
jgi:hypothetical protein